MLKNEPEAVVNAIRDILKKSSEVAQEEQQVAAGKLDKKYESMKPVNEIVGLLKATDKADKANQQVKKEKGLVGNQHKLDKNKNGKLDSHDFKLLRKEEAEQTDEARHSDPGKRVLRDVAAMEKRAKPSMAELDKNKMMSSSDKSKLGKVAELMKREKEMKKEKEDKDEKEMHEARFEKGEDVGKPGMMFGKIAAKAAKKYGSKEAGKRVAGAVLKKVLAKKAMKEEMDLEEGRGRPRKNPNDPKWQKKSGDGEEHEGLGPDSGKEADQHIHVRLAAAADQDKGADHKFDNGKTRNIPQHVAKTVYSGLNRMKPDVRAKMHDHIQKSHENLMQVHSMLAGKK